MSARSAVNVAKPKTPPPQYTALDILLATSHVNMFWPKNREDLLITHPELRKYKELQNVSGNPRQLLFVYFFACKWSPGQVLQSEADRITLALKAAWGRHIPKEIDEPYRNKQWGAQMQLAINVMRSFEPDVRTRMRLIFRRSVENVTRLMEENADTVKTWDEKLKYFKTLEAGMDILHKNQRYIEEGSFGITEATDDQFDSFEEGEVMEELMREERSSKQLPR